MTGPELKAARIRMGLTGSELGERIGRTPGAISRYENGGRPIATIVSQAVVNLETAMRAAGALPKQKAGK